MYARFRSIALGCFIACIPSVAAGGTIYVDQDAAGANTGTSWHDAFVDLQDALTTAVPGDEIWVAEGTYKPDGGTLDPSISFVLPSGVAIYGGFAGDETTRSQRDWRAHQTILTGDLLGDDLVTPEEYWWFVARVDNTRHLVRASLTAPTTLDGFGIEHGSAWTDHDGAGLLHDGGALTLVNCRFQWNSQYMSSGEGEGGAIYSGDYWNGGCPDCELTIVNSHFENNHATVAGGALSVTQTRAVKLFNCSLLDHGADWYADALFLWLTDVELVNCTVAARDGGSWYQDSDVTIENATGSIANSVFYGKYDDEARNLKFYGDRPTIDYSCVRGWSGTYGGVGNFDAAPVFLDLQNGDLRLNCGSPCIDAGDSGALPPDLLDLDGDGDTLEPIPLDAGGTPRRQDDPSTPDTGTGPTPIVDLGALEFVEPTGPDCNGNGHADLCDLGLGSSFDCNANRVPDECDIASGASADCNLNTIPDECEPDCNGNLVPDDCDIATGVSRDCDGDAVPDECEPVQCCDILDFRARCRSGRVRAALRLADDAHDGEQVTIRIGETSFTVTVVGDAARAFLPHQSGTISVELVEPAGCADPIILECGEPLKETPDSYGPG